MRATGKAGLYRFVTGKIGKTRARESGWVVLPDGSRRGATNFIDPIGGFVRVKPAPRLSPGAKQLTSGFIDRIGNF